MTKLFKPFFFFLVLISCSRNPYKETNKVYKQQSKQYAAEIKKIPPVQLVSDSVPLSPYWVGTTNFNMRKPSYVIIHHTAQHSTEQTLKTFTMPSTSVSAHYVIGKNGQVYQMLNDYMRAWHAGISRWGNELDMNSASIGIELDNDGYHAFDSLQINSLLVVLSRLKAEYKIPTANFIGHADIAPARKTDPNWRFPWKLLAEKGYGLWYDEIRDTVPTDFNHINGLRIVGYDVKDTSAAIVAFKRHFLQDTTKGMTPFAKELLFNLQRKYF
ncbi:MAG: N-acetylmuramoyl-L-alanine amidase [Sphingobacteriia bacterium]|nr:MAG: N-acetylmuramoyl-L-alanine amidase [Sphingobacteriia bacterium]TAG32165.1 MAG: N-acetylmuramoyl-L-alanine amidase [Sphingobacteriia bacterium]TAH09306.1 MAG: N-acetylmuramoyl-L-alanine amidase [Sphingobacteriia bacterium]